MSPHIFIAFLLAMTVTNVTSEPKKEEKNPFDIIKCNTQPGDVELVHVQIVDPGHNAGKVGIDFIYPPEDMPAKNAINCIIIKNLDDVGAGTATITSGDLGDTRLNIHLSSSFTKGAGFTIQLMGQPKIDIPTEAP